MAFDPPMVSGVTEKTLTHELGAGAPCLKCGDKCPGLDLHFWRKICRNCKCKQEDHDVQSTISSKGIDNIGKLLMQDKEARLEPISKNSSEDSPTKQNRKIPKPAPKPVKEIKSTEEKFQSGADPKKVDGLNFTVDLNGQKHTLDFGSNVNDLPPPPENDFPDPPAVEDAPALVDEFKEKVAVQEPVETESTIDAPPTEFVQTEKNASPVKQSEQTSTNEEEVYEWKPPVQDPVIANKYVAALPEDKRPIVGSSGAKYRKKQLMRQLPAHDQEPKECHDLTDQETKEMALFVKQYREKALGGAVVEESDKVKSCAECRERFNIGDAVVYAERMGQEKRWHPSCFTCSECKELLVDLIYFYNDDKIYCGRHYCELHKPRCAACDELIFAPEYTQAEDCYWHLKHFCCWHCDQPLGGKNYVPHDNQPVCITCYEKAFAHTCSTCKKIIAPNTEWVTFEDHHWHAHPDCFKCSQCSQSLVGKPCIPKEDMVFCCSKCKRERIPQGQ